MTSLLEQRLLAQLKADNVKNADKEARRILVERGHVRFNGDLTVEGKKRQDLGAEGRAIDRACKNSSHKPEEFVYDRVTNRARLRNKYGL